MAELDAHSSGHLSALRRHVLGPVVTATEAAVTEATEVRLERDAFEEFADRVAEFAPERPREPGPPSVVGTGGSSGRADALRRAYAETVTAVPHYDAVYGESIPENAAAEMGAGAASLLDPAGGVRLTEANRRLLTAAARRAAGERDDFLDALDVELRSLRCGHDSLAALLDELDASVVPSWYHERFEERLATVVETRQAELSGRSVPYLDGHDVCEYLYADEPWTHPVCTAVARLSRSVGVRD